MDRLPPFRDGADESGGYLKWILLGILIAAADAALIYLLWTGQILGY